MSKRVTKSDEPSERPAKTSKKHWSLGLVESMKDPASVYKQTDKIVVIKDKYPKARIHYLVLPVEEIRSIYKLDKSHLDLLSEFGSMYETIQSEHTKVELKAGFHAVPSMQRLHMHVINVLKKLKEDGRIEKIPSETHKALMSTPLTCNQCSFEPKNMPQLKQHLLTHIK